VITRNHATREIQKRALHLAHDPLQGPSTLGGARQTFNKEGLLKGFALLRRDRARADANFKLILKKLERVYSKEDD
jgi:hypothetical protein